MSLWDLMGPLDRAIVCAWFVGLIGGTGIYLWLGLGRMASIDDFVWDWDAGEFRHKKHMRWDEGGDRWVSRRNTPGSVNDGQ